MATMYFHKAQTGLFMGIYFSHSGKNLAPIQNCPGGGGKVGQIKFWGSWCKAEISLFMMVVYVFTLFIRLSLIFLNMQMKYFCIPPLDEMTGQIVSLLYKVIQGWCLMIVWG